VEQRLARIADVVDVDDMAGSSVVVVFTADGIDEVAGDIATHAPASVVAVAVDPDAETCEALYRGTLFPASRIVGCAPGGDMADAACRVAEAALLAGSDSLRCTVRRDGRFEAHEADVGLRGVARVLD